MDLRRGVHSDVGSCRTSRDRRPGDHDPYDRREDGHGSTFFIVGGAKHAERVVGPIAFEFSFTI